jgi:hypothetical protein
MDIPRGAVASLHLYKTLEARWYRIGTVGAAI